ncbi:MULTISPECIES: maleylpyruvate isomerase N-terminal domain-containing protein [Actinosynnema]|uniref:maleylpyruvate isomerase N-terminal domain-containing protein n=1 Tax=Actinosynnema TaxID=40566 RepID=UPI0020A392DC|nr:maleylpyruvate isomerase N-terminal domain-containing protein [Actinosynnema pretiosum]
MGIDLRAAVAEHGDGLEAAARGRFDAPVPACPGWVVGDLVRHVAEVQLWWAAALPAGGAAPEVDEVRREVGELFDGEGPDGLWLASARLRDAAGRVGDDAPVWAWWSPTGRTPATEVLRRVAHELVVHRHDACAAVGEPVTASPELAEDGVAEFAERLLGGDLARPGVVELRAVDTGRTWLIGSAGDGLRLLDAAEADRVRAGGGAGGALSGTAELLHLALWRRVAPDRLVVEGDGELVRAAITASRLG